MRQLVSCPAVSSPPLPVGDPWDHWPVPVHRPGVLEAVLQPWLCLTPRGMVKGWAGAVGMAGDAWESWQQRDDTAFWRGDGEWVEDGAGDRDGNGNRDEAVPLHGCKVETTEPPFGACCCAGN